MLYKVKEIIKPSKDLVKEITRYGYSFSLATFWKLLFATILAVTFICWYFRLAFIFSVIICLIALILLPKLILSVYYNLYEQARFSDVNNYLEQMMYSFQKNPNILFCLEETSKIFPNGQMKDAISMAIDVIRQNEDKELYESAFHKIESVYPCSRMNSLHQFLINVELYGGSFDGTLNILLEDRRLWIERTYELQQEKKRTKTRIMVSIVFATIICSFLSYIVPEQFEIRDNFISQFFTTAYLVASIFLGYFAQIKLSGTWLQDRDFEDKDKVLKDYELAVNPPRKQLRKKATIKGLILLIFAGISILISSPLTLTLFCFFSSFLCFTSPSRKIKLAKKHTIRKIQKDFPIWMMELILLLQSNNVHIALYLSKEKVPTVLKKDLDILLDKLEETPNSINPFLEFLKEFDIPDVISSMRMLYAMDAMGTGDSQSQFTTLITRNNHLLDKAKRVQADDEMAVYGFLVYMPMLFGTVKMLADMLLLLIAITTKIKL